MRSFFFGITTGLLLSIIVIQVLFNFTAIHLNKCYLTPSGQQIAWAAAVAFDGEWVWLGTTQSYDFIVMGDYKPCEEGSEP